VEILLRPVSTLAPSLISDLISDLDAISPWSFTLGPPIQNLNHAYLPDRGQFDADGILVHLLNEINDQGKVIGLIDVDLCTPVLSFVFGRAQLGGRVAVVSTFRLDNRFYRLKPDPGLLIERLKKEIIHEAGHLGGLYHCRNRWCVMNASASIVNIDLKGFKFCPACLNYLKERGNNGP